MSDTPTDPVEEIEAPAPEPEAPVLEAPETPAPAPAPAPPPAEDWRERRIAQLTARLREAERKVAAAASPPPADPAATPSSPDPAELERLVEERAGQQAAVQEFNRRCDEVAGAGRAQFSDFNDRITDLQRLVSPGDPAAAGAYHQFLLAAIDTGEAPELLHRLGGNLNEAARIMALPAHRMGIELARLAASPQSGDPSGAPRPIRPLTPAPTGAGPIDPTDTERADRLSTREWMARREAQLARKRA